MYKPLPASVVIGFQIVVNHQNIWPQKHEMAAKTSETRIPIRIGRIAERVSDVLSIEKTGNYAIALSTPGLALAIYENRIVPVRSSVP